MITKEKIISILQSYSFNVQDQTGDKYTIVDSDDFEKIAEEILSDDEIDWDDDFLSDD